MICIPGYPQRPDFPSTICFCLFLGPAFCQHPETLKKTSLPNSIEISKNHILDAQCFYFDAFRVPCGPPFSISVPGLLNLINCNNCDTKPSFLQFQDSHWGIKKKHTFLDIVFLTLCWTFQKQYRFGDPLQNPVGAKIRRRRLVSGVVKQRNVESAKMVRTWA